jgi:hypothetical protein
LQQRIEVIDRSVQRPAALAGRGAQGTAGVAEHRLGITDHRFGDTGQLPGDSQYRSLAFLACRSSSQTQLGRDRAGP